MFPSYGVATVFVFVILLNIFYLHSPVESTGDRSEFGSCDECMISDCHTKKCQPCLDKYAGNGRSNVILCITCETQNGFEQFYTEEECTKKCKDSSKTCGCDGACYKCILKNLTNTLHSECYIPGMENYKRCE